MTIARLIEGRSSAVFSCTAETSVREAITLLAEKRIGALPVLAGDAIAGIFSERDLVYRLTSDGPAVLDMPVGAVMTAPAVTWKDVWAAMKRNGWTWKGGSGLMTDYYYIKPRCKVQGGKAGRDCFVRVEDAMGID